MASVKWILTTEERMNYIRALTSELASLRATAGISQAELSNMIGISRQTYSAIEGKKTTMSWSTYLSLILFFDYNSSTHDMLRDLPAFPEDIIIRMNEGKNYDQDILSEATGELNEILSALDDQARHTIKTTLLVEYARCRNVSDNKVIKTFEGLDLTGSAPDTATEIALRNIKKKKR